MTPRPFERPAPAALPESLRSRPELNVESIDGTVLSPIVAHAFERAAALPAVTEAAIAAARRERAERFARLGVDEEGRTGVFEAALAQPGRRVILEVKAASPSKGLMRAEVNAAEYARVYGRFADAVSILTEPKYFGGSFGRLAAFRVFTAKPLLAKDFIVSERQILAAHAAGADAVLLMLSVLSHAGYEALTHFAARLGLEVLTEASTEAEVRHAVAAGARMIGINNRNLRTLEVDLDRAPALARLVPAGRVVVAESGCRTHRDMGRAQAAAPQINAFLCGSALSAAPDLSRAVRELVFGRTKCCGITRVEDALEAARAGAAAVGIICAPRSRRYVPLERALELARAVRAAAQAEGLPLELFAVTDVGDFKRVRTAAAGVFDFVQVHGYRSDFAALPGTPGVVPAFGMGGLDQAGARALARRICSLEEEGRIAGAVLDNSDARGSGGTGRTFDFSLMDAFADVPNLFIAGGLSPENAFAALSAGGFAAAGADLNSGVESAPGIKSKALLEAAFRALRGIPA